MQLILNHCLECAIKVFNPFLDIIFSRHIHNNMQKAFCKPKCLNHFLLQKIRIKIAKKENKSIRNFLLAGEEKTNLFGVTSQIKHY
jgi:hypothetical protein